MKTKAKNPNRAKAQYLRHFHGRVAACRSGRFGRVTDVKIDGNGRPVFLGHEVTKQIAGYGAPYWLDHYTVAWQSRSPKWEERDEWSTM